MAAVDRGDRHGVSFELLALFDDVSALSGLENSSLDPSYFDMLLEDIQATKVENTHWEPKLESPQTQPKKDQIDNKNVFAVPKMYNCLYCLKRFYSRTASRRHQVCHMKQQLRCPCCRARSYSIGAVRRHIEYFHYCPRRRYILIEAH